MEEVEKLKYESLGKVLKAERTNAGLTQTQLAERMSKLMGTSVHQGTLARTERGERAPTLAECVAFGSILDIDGNTIFRLLLPADSTYLDRISDNLLQAEKEIEENLRLLVGRAAMAIVEFKQTYEDNGKRNPLPILEALDVADELIEDIRAAMKMLEELKAIFNKQGSRFEDLARDMYDYLNEDRPS